MQFIATPAVARKVKMAVAGTVVEAEEEALMVCTGGSLWKLAVGSAVVKMVYFAVHIAVVGEEEGHRSTVPVKTGEEEVQIVH